MARIVETFEIRNNLARQYIRSVDDRLGRKASTDLIRGFLKRANDARTPRRRGRLQRSFRVVRLTLYKYRISWGAFYASYVNDRGRSKGYVRRVKRHAHNELNTRARQVVG